MQLRMHEQCNVTRRLSLHFKLAILSLWLPCVTPPSPHSACRPRYLLRDWVESFVRKKWKKWEYIDKAIELDGWKLVLIMRFSPIIPYNILNIAMGTTSIPFWQVRAGRCGGARGGGAGCGSACRGSRRGAAAGEERGVGRRAMTKAAAW